MEADRARQLLAEAQVDDEEPVCLPASVLAELDISDVVKGTAFEVGEHRDGVVHIDWNGTIHRHGDTLFGEVDHTETRKHWYSPLGLEQYFDLVRRAVEVRQRKLGDASVTHYEDDGAFIFLKYQVRTDERNLGEAYATFCKISAEIEETAQRAAKEVRARVAEIAAQLS